MKSNSSTRELPLTVSRDNLISAIVTQLQAFKAIPNSADVINIIFGDLTKDPVTLRVILKEEVDVLTF